jgi:quinol monooxygenase YgiN
MIVNTMRITVSPEKRAELFQTIDRLVAPIESFRGCRTSRFYVDATDEYSSVLISEWETETDLNTYLNSKDFAILRGALSVLNVSSSDSTAFVTSRPQSSAKK